MSNKLVPYQFQLPPDLRKAGTDKASKYGFNLANLFRIHWQNFLDRPIEESLNIVGDHSNQRKKQTVIPKDDRRKI